MAMTIEDSFRGDDAKLISCIESLITLNDAGALMPHGIGGHARTLLSSAAARLQTHITQPAQAVDVEKVAAVGYEAWMDDPGLWLHANNMERSRWTKIAQAIITRALSGEKAGPVGDEGSETAALVRTFEGKLLYVVHPENVLDKTKELREIAFHSVLGDHVLFISKDPLPASPTPGKEGEG